MSVQENVVRKMAMGDRVMEKSMALMLRLAAKDRKGPRVEGIELVDSDDRVERKKRDFTLVFYDGSRVRVETKSDFASETSHNIAVEYRSGGKPSGLATTEADVWVQMVPDPSSASKWKAYVANARVLREALMRQVAPGSPWTPNRRFMGEEPNGRKTTGKYRFQKTIPNVRCEDDVRTECMILRIDQHVKGVGMFWWKDSAKLRPGTVVWQKF